MTTTNGAACRRGSQFALCPLRRRSGRIAGTCVARLQCARGVSGDLRSDLSAALSRRVDKDWRSATIVRRNHVAGHQLRVVRRDGELAWR